MSWIFGVLEKRLILLSTFLARNKILTAIKDAFILSIPFTVIGSFAGLIKVQLQYFFGSDNSVVIKNVIDVFGAVNQTAFGFIGIIIVLAAGYFYGNLLRSDNPKIIPFTSSLVSLLAYMLTVPAEIISPEGKAISGYALSYFNYEGMFAGLVIGIATTAIYNRLTMTKFTIKLHESVPPAIMQSFLALIPVTVVMLLFAVVKSVILLFGFNSLQMLIRTVIMEPLMTVGTGLSAILVVISLMQLLWFFGLHGFSIMWGVISALWLPLFLHQVDIYSNTHDLSLITQVAPNTISNIYAMIGGSGSTLALIAVLLLMAKKGTAEKAIAKMSAIPGLFNINEPIIFGLPIVLNPVMFIPFVFVPLFNAIIAWFAISWGIVTPMVVLNSGVEPVFLNAFVLGGFNVSPVLLMMILFVIDMFIYAPFVHVLLKQKMMQDNK